MSDHVDVLVSVNDVGPMLGRLYAVERIDFDAIGPDLSHIRRPSSARVHIAAIPHRYVERLRPAVESLGYPVQVRVWPEIGPMHYSFRAYGHYDISTPLFYGLILQSTDTVEIRQQ